MKASIDEHGTLMIKAETQQEADDAYIWFKKYECADETGRAEVSIPSEFVTDQMIGGEEIH